MGEQYDELVDLCEEVHDAISLFRERVEFPSFRKALGSVKGKRVLDAGCGEGIYARMAAREGAAHVAGVDSSSEMVGIARSIEAEEALGIDYQVHDVAVMPTLGTFDVVIAVNVLHYARSHAALASMCERIVANLAPGGRLLAYVGNFNCDRDTAEELGFVIDRPLNAMEGDACTLSFRSTPPVTIEVYYWTPQTIEQSLIAAGLASVTWEPLIAEPAAGDDTALLERCLQSPVDLLLSAHKVSEKEPIRQHVPC
jgi:SAM-dependent methyltransferase